MCKRVKLIENKDKYEFIRNKDNRSNKTNNFVMIAPLNQSKVKSEAWREAAKTEADDKTIPAKEFAKLLHDRVGHSGPNIMRTTNAHYNLGITKAGLSELINCKCQIVFEAKLQNQLSEAKPLTDQRKRKIFWIACTSISWVHSPFIKKERDSNYHLSKANNIFWWPLMNIPGMCGLFQ